MPCASPALAAALRSGEVRWWTSGYAAGAYGPCSRMKRLTRPRAGRPENARVSSVRTKRGLVRDCLCTACAPDSGVARNAVPSCAAFAPAASAAAIWLPRMMPPAATTGICTVSRTWVIRESSPIPVPSVSGLSRWVPW